MHNKEYEIEGKYRKGTCKAVVSEVRLYDIRIQKEAMPQLLKDFNVITGEGIKSHSKYGSHAYTGLLGYTFRFGMWILRKVLDLKKPVVSDKEAEKQLDNWYYAWTIGNKTDPDIPDAGGEIL